MHTRSAPASARTRTSSILGRLWPHRLSWELRWPEGRTKLPGMRGVGLLLTAVSMAVVSLALMAACAPAASSQPSSSSEPLGSAAPAAVRVPLGSSPVSGPDDALVTIVEFVDLECQFCSHVHPTIQRLMKEHPGDVRWVVKHNPLSFHARALPAALLSIELHRQRGDAAFFDGLSTILSAERIDAALFQSLIRRFQLEPAGVARALSLGAEHPELMADQDLAIDLEVRGTPNFFINGVQVSGAQPYATFEAVVLAQKTRALELVSSGVPREQLYGALQAVLPPPPALRKVPVPVVEQQMPALGPADAPVTVQVFSDFECPYCSRVMPTLDQLRARYPDRVRIVWRHLPLPFHRNARTAAAAAEEARRQQGNEAFWALARRMLGTPESPPELLDRQTLQRYAEELGLEVDAFQAALGSERHSAAIERDAAVATRLGIDATPGFVINGYRLLGAHPPRRFERLVRLALAEHGAPPASPAAREQGQ